NVYVVDPANFFLDPGAYDLQDAAWCGTLVPMLVNEAKARWPKFAHLLVPEYKFNYSEIYWRPATFQAFQATAGEAGGAYLNIFEGWEKSHRKCPCGADRLDKTLPNGDPNPAYRPPGHEEGLVRILMAGATSGAPLILERQPHFYRHGKYPFAVFKDIPIAKSFWGQGEASQVESLQEMRNRLIEQVAINAYLTGNNQKWLRPGSGINPTNITNEPGKVYISKIDNPLNPIKTENIPQYIFELLALTKSDANEVAGMFTAPPAGIRAGYAIIALLERMAARVKRKSMRFERGIKEIIKFVIAYYQEFSTEARLVRITDSAGLVQFFPFKGTDYADAEVDVDINLGLAKPFARDMLQQMATPLLNMKQVDGQTPVLMPSEFLEAIGWPFRGTIERNRKLEAQFAAGKQAQEDGTMPEGYSTLLEGTEQPSQSAGGAQRPPGVSPQVTNPGMGQGNGRSPTSRMNEGLGKAQSGSQ
ncbi:MAG: hypothetical protein KGL39_36985, partial [Patescibacteria group bacterium]|nr:hypothetical protein [Patescibacteria group bacterium]